MKWTGGSKESLSKRQKTKSGLGGVKRSNPNDVFFGTTMPDTSSEAKSNRVGTSTSKRVQNNLASISQWTQAAGLTTTVTHGTASSSNPTESELRAKPQSLLKTATLTLPSASFETSLPPSSLIGHDNTKAKTNTDDAAMSKDPPSQFAMKKLFTEVHTNDRRRDSSTHVMAPAEPTSMQPSFAKPNSSREPSKSTRVKSEPEMEEAKIPTVDERVQFSPGSTKFFAARDVTAPKQKARAKEILFWNEGRPARYITPKT